MVFNEIFVVWKSDMNDNLFEFIPVTSYRSTSVCASGSLPAGPPFGSSLNRCALRGDTVYRQQRIHTYGFSFVNLKWGGANVQGRQEE